MRKLTEKERTYLKSTDSTLTEEDFAKRLENLEWAEKFINNHKKY